MATTNLMPDDRRSLTIRLSVLQYLVRGGVRGAGGRVLDLPDRPAREVPRDRREQPHCASCRCRRRAACCSIATARSWSRTRTRSTSRWCASRPRTCRDVLRRARRRDRRRRGAAARDGQPPPPRADLPPDRPDRERHAASRSSPSWARRLELPGVFYQEVPSRKYPGERHGGAPVRLRRRGHRAAAAARRLPGGRARHASSGRPASSSPTTSS